MLRIEVPFDEAELIADALWTAGASAVGEERREGVVMLTADLDECPPALAGWPHVIGDDDGAWRDGWRPFARSIHVGPFVVRPPWVTAAVPPGAVELVLDAGRAFGTGTHSSTTLALRALAGVARPGMTVLDAGCGSGALAVAAALLDADRVVAVDIDPEAIVATKVNAAANGVSPRVEVGLGPVEEVVGAFDVVVANLGAPLVHDLAPALLARQAAGGCLILSGMLGDQHDRLAAAYPTATTVHWTDHDGWTCAVVGVGESGPGPDG